MDSLKWLAMSVIITLSGCALTLSRETSSMEKSCQQVSLLALQARDDATKADSARMFALLNARIENLEKTDHDIEMQLEELLKFARSRNGAH